MNDSAKKKKFLDHLVTEINAATIIRKLPYLFSVQERRARVLTTRIFQVAV